MFSYEAAQSKEGGANASSYRHATPGSGHEGEEPSTDTRRSSVENMRSRSLDGQRVEVQIACKSLNRMTLFGVPDSAKVA